MCWDQAPDAALNGGCGLSDDLGVDAPVVLQPELRQHREDAQLVDQVRRIEDVGAVRIVGIALDDQVLLERREVLDEAVVHILLILRDQLGLDDAGSDDGLTGAELGAVIRQLVARDISR